MLSDGGNDSLHECTDCPMMCALPTVYVHSWIPFPPHQSSFHWGGLLALFLNPLLHDTCSLVCLLGYRPHFVGQHQGVCVSCGWVDGWMYSLIQHLFSSHHQYCTVTGDWYIEPGCETRVNEGVFLIFCVCLCVQRACEKINMAKLDPA